MNWRRGLFRLWTALAAAWIVGSVWYADPASRFAALSRTVTLRWLNEKYEFPAYFTVSDIKRSLVDQIRKGDKERDAELRRKIATKQLTKDEELEIWLTEYYDGHMPRDQNEANEMYVLRAQNESDEGYERHADEIVDWALPRNYQPSPHQTILTVLRDIGKIVLLPPVALFALGMILIWVVQGFLPRRINSN